MGDRGNIKVVDHKGRAVYVYGHWQGGDLPGVARRALIAADLKDARGNRWDDAPYLTAFVAREMDDRADGWPGCAIATYIPDNEYPVVIFDTRDQTVRLADCDWDTRAETERPDHWSMREVAESGDPAALLGWTES